MKIIGFDFGTTNSTISYYDPESKTLQNFRLSASSNEYIPTAISYSVEKDNDISIGLMAKNKLTAKKFETYENFKLRLGRNYDQTIEGKTKTPIKVTRDYIEKLLAIYKKEQKVDKLDGIVMTVPETWFTEASNQTARENIEQIYKDLGYSDLEFLLESEPVAAAAYFCWAFKNDDETNKKRNEYNGFITVVDYGGGTLDVTLCEVTKGGNKSKGGNIKILERCGFGEYNDTNGCAGVAFDEAVIEKVIKDNNLAISKGSSQFLKLRDEFEKAKILERDLITKKLSSYIRSPLSLVGDENILFSLEYTYDGDELDISCEDMVSCFNNINAPALNDSLNQVKQFFNAHNIDSSSQDNFKVLLVGGFSNFCVVESVVRNFFASKINRADERFKLPFKELNRALAISRGAALIAKKEITIDHTCTHSIGYLLGAYDAQERLIYRDIPVIKKATNLSEVQEAQYSPTPVQVNIKTGSLKIFMDDGRPNNAGRIQVALDESVKELFPNTNKPDNEYHIGFSVNKNLIPTIHIKDKSGAVESKSLNKLLERMAIMQK